MKRGFPPEDLGTRAAYSLGSGTAALVLYAAFAEGPQGWGTAAPWIFSAAVAALAFALYHYID